MQHPAPDRALSFPAPLRVGMLGIGVVGSGTHRLITRNRQIIRDHAGRDIDLAMVAARNVVRARQIVGPGIEVVDDPIELVQSPRIDVVVEAIGGCTAARSLVLEAIAHRKHVVTANKALLAHHGEEIFAAARGQGVIVAFEGAVAVSIPIVKALREGLAANRVEWLAGIVNGTSNFILTQMREGAASFEVALREAQRLGFAEADPAFDVEGIDAGHKLALLASIAFGTPIQFDLIPIEGISALAPEDLRYAERLGYSIKQLALARRTAGRIELRVVPALLPLSSLLARVDGSMNGVMVKSDAAGLTMYYGAGAGSDETASAVVADLIDVARLAGAAHRHTVPSLGFRMEARSPLELRPVEEILSRRYLRFATAGEALSQVSNALAAHGIVIRAHVDETAAGEGDLVLVTDEVREDTLMRALPDVCALAEVRRLAAHLCVEMLV